MPPKKVSRKRLRALCADVHEDDGVDPREFFKMHRDRPKTDRKTRQLCGQVAEILNQTFAGHPDDVLRGLLVASVEPAPDAAHLLVTVQATLVEEGIGPLEILGRLGWAAGQLRSEVATAITRRRAPSLAFHVAGPLGAGEGNP